MYVREGTKKSDPILGLRRPEGSIGTNGEEKAQILANHFQTVYTRERSLPDVGLPSHPENAKIVYVKVLWNDVNKILKSLKKTSPRARMAFHHTFKGIGGRDQIPSYYCLINILFKLL